MKIKIIIALATIAAISVGAFVVAGGGTKLNAAELEKMRGSDGYYADGDMMTLPDPMGVPHVLASCADAGKIVKVAFDLQYKVGKEWVDTPEMAATAFTDHAVEVRSALILMIASKREDEMIRGGAGVRFLEEIRSMMNEIVFPKQMARIEKVLVKEMLVQG